LKEKSHVHITQQFERSWELWGLRS
jgi:hypothetical protein